MSESSPQIEPCTLHVDDNCFRKSKRNPSNLHLSKKDVNVLLEKIRTNDASTVVLKIKDHISADVNSLVLDEIIKTLYDNKVCQALYVQNLNQAMHDEQLVNLTALLKRKKIWCVNLGENYNVSNHGWTEFCKALPKTYVTHMYVSEHTISPKLKVAMRKNIRDNRQKHNRHKSVRNLKVITQCTNMWWNPSNHFRHQLESKVVEVAEVTCEERNKRLKFSDIEWTPESTGFWAEGVGKGGDQPWKFNCKCGEKCSSYENFRYHPVGRMFECSKCKTWCHTDCIYGPKVSNEYLEELEVVVSY
jgi:hypothetical protein